MPVQPWIPETFSSAIAGVSSGISPDLVSANQLAWLLNGACRGDKPTTRPAYKFRTMLPPGLVQGAGYFGIQGGMGVCAIRGQLYRLRIGGAYTFEEIALDSRNSQYVRQVWMQQTVESLVIQNSESNPIIYDGSTARRADSLGMNGDPEVPRGRQMAYGNGRLWVAVNDKELVAGDIRQKDAGSELKFTETNYLLGGGSIFFQDGITALAFIATNGSADYGPLMAFCPNHAESIRADITSRDQWGQPGFITNVLRRTGCSSQWSVAAVNQDLYWRDSDGGLRSVYSSGTDESMAGNNPLSREVSRLTDYDSKQLLGFCSAIYFDNRLLVTASPFLNDAGGVSWRSLIALDFAPFSSMQGKSAPAYDGQWSGLDITHMFTGMFNGRPRAFVIARHTLQGNVPLSNWNSLWEIMPTQSGQVDDETVNCAGEGAVAVPNPIQVVMETGRRSFLDASTYGVPPVGGPRYRKRLERCDLYISEIDGEVDFTVWWRQDNAKKWQFWDTFTVCSKTTDPATTTPHTFLNLLRQYRSQVKSLSIPQAAAGTDAFALQTGFEFQFRVGWVGRCSLYKVVAYATPLPEDQFARRDLTPTACEIVDVSGNEITYEIPLNGDPLVIDLQPPDVIANEGDSNSFGIHATGAVPITYQWQVRVSDGSGVDWTDLTDGGVFSGVETAVMTLTAIPYSMNGDIFRCLVSNPFMNSACSGSKDDYVASDVAHLTVIGTSPVITTQPVGHPSMAPTTPVQFSVVATGSGQLSYQWQMKQPDDGAWHTLYNGLNSVVGTFPLVAYVISGANQPTLNIDYSNTLNYYDIRTHYFRCVVTNAVGSAASNNDIYNVLYRHGLLSGRGG